MQECTFKELDFSYTVFGSVKFVLLSIQCLRIFFRIMSRKEFSLTITPRETACKSFTIWLKKCIQQANLVS